MTALPPRPDAAPPVDREPDYSKLAPDEVFELYEPAILRNWTDRPERAREWVHRYGWKVRRVRLSPASVGAREEQVAELVERVRWNNQGTMPGGRPFITLDDLNALLLLASPSPADPERREERFAAMMAYCRITFYDPSDPLAYPIEYNPHLHPTEVAHRKAMLFAALDSLAPPSPESR